MKKLFTIPVIIVVILLIIVVYKKKQQAPAPQPVAAQWTKCFDRSVTATNDAPYTVHEHIALTVSGDTVSGMKSGTQSGPDMTNGYDGTLTGTQSNNLFDLLFSYTIEGSAQTEKELYVLRDGVLVKQRYPLIDNGTTLVPDTTQPYTEQAYQPADCAGR